MSRIGFNFGLCVLMSRIGFNFGLCVTTTAVLQFNWRLMRRANSNDNNSITV